MSLELGQIPFPADHTPYASSEKADGRDTRGAGNASAMITAKLESVDATTTKVDVTTDLTITGKVAQFGRGIMADVSSNLLTQFANNLASMLEAGDDGAEPAETGSEGGATAASAEAVDLLDLAGASVLKRVLPLVVVLVAVVIILILVL